MVKANKSYLTPGPELLKWITKTHISMYEMTDGMLGGAVFQIGEKGTSLLRQMNVLLLTTKGRKSGQPRKVTLPYFQYDGRIVVIGSNGGSEKNPDWFVNLKANPRVHVQLQGARFEAEARSLEGAEYDDVWNRHVASWPRWTIYQQATSRKIPIVHFKLL